MPNEHPETDTGADDDGPDEELAEPVGREPGSPGVVGEQPNRFERGGAEPLDESPDGQTPSDVTDSGAESVPPGSS